jgi:hypothetical protein
MSCNKENNQAIVCGSKTFIFIDDDGNDIFNENTVNHISTDELKAYTPEGRILNIEHLTFENENNFIIDLNGLEGEGITYIELGSITTATIFIRSQEKENTTFISELYYNNILLETNEHEGECSLNNPKRITVISD